MTSRNYIEERAYSPETPETYEIYGGLAPYANKDYSF